MFFSSGDKLWFDTTTFSFLFNWPILTGDHTRLGRISQRSPKEPLGISGVRFFLQAKCLSCCPVDSVEVLKEDGRFDRTVDQTFYLVIISFSNPAVKIVHLASARAPVWGCSSMGCSMISLCGLRFIVLSCLIMYLSCPDPT